MIDRGKRSKTLNELKPVSEFFKDIDRSKRKSSPHKLRGHAYELNEDKARISTEFDSQGKIHIQ